MSPRVNSCAMTNPRYATVNDGSQWSKRYIIII